MLVLTVALLLQQQGAIDSLTLEDALRRARSTRPEFAAISARVREAEAVRSQVSRPPNPVADYSRVSETESQRAGISQPLAPLVRLVPARASASEALGAARADSAQAVAELERAVRRAWFGALAAQGRLVRLGELADIADSLAAAAARRSAAGDLADLERRQFDLEAAVAGLAFSRAREDAALKRAELSRQVGGGAESVPLRGAMDAALNEGTSAAPTAVAGIPRVRRAAAVARSAALQASAARWARLPLASVYAEHEWSRLVATTASTRIGFSVNLPLFSLGNETVRIAAARATAAEAAARETELEAERDVAAALARLRETQARATVASTRLGPESALLREGTVRLFDAGRVSVLQVLDALRAERQAQLLVLDELLAFQEARADLDALLGRTTPLSSQNP